MAEAVLSSRSQQVLKSLIECYIRDGQPVGSKTLVREAGLRLSAASIRNVMAELESLGLIHAPHTSAGRIPTSLGYRLFVDSLVTVQPLRTADLEALQASIDSKVGTQGLLESTSSLLSGITNMAGIVMLPRHENAALKHIEFLPLSDKRVLGVLVFTDGEIQNRIVTAAREFSSAELQRISNFLNEQLKGKGIDELKESLLRDLRNTRAHIDKIMLEAIDMAHQALESPVSQPGYVLAGQTNLMAYQEMGDVARLRELFEAFNEKHTMLHLLDQSLSASGVQIFIGSESGYRALEECSVVTATYSVDDRVLGVLGVIGPTRMAYERVIPIVDVTAKLLSNSLKQRM